MVMKKLLKQIGPKHLNGASIVGLQKVVIKSHGGADAFAFGKALEMALRESEKNIPEVLRGHLLRLEESLSSDNSGASLGIIKSEGNDTLPDLSSSIRNNSGE